MLELMRKHARNWLMKVLLGIIIIVFIFYFGSIRGDKQAESIAIIDDKTISYTDFRNEYQNLINFYRQRFGDTLTDDILKGLNLKQLALDNLINQAIATRKADELKLHVSDDEVRTFIFSYPAFQKNGVFDNYAYQQRLRYHKMIPEDFEASQKMALKIAKLEELIKESVKVSEKEIYDIYKIQNEKINIGFVKVAMSSFRAKVKPTDAALEKHFKEHSESFRIPEKVQIKYIRFFGKDFANAIKISDKEAADYYNLNKTNFTKSGGETPPFPKIKNKIIAEIKLRGGMAIAREEAQKAHDIIYQEENFEDYAAKNKWKINASEPFSEKNLPNELSQIKGITKYAFNLKEGEISPVLPSPEGFYIIKFISRNPSYIPELTETRKEIEKDYVEKEAVRLCRKEAEKILNYLKTGEDISKFYPTVQIEISDTGFFVPNSDIPKIGFSRELGEALFQISERTPYPDKVFYVDEGFVIIKFKERESLNKQDFEAKKADLKKLLLKIKQREYYHSWIEETRASMTKKGKIKITRDISEL